MTVSTASDRPPVSISDGTDPQPGERHARLTLAATVFGFFVITLDAVVVNVTLPAIRADLGGGITGLQWVVDGYTLTFAALLLSAGSGCNATSPSPLRTQRRAARSTPPTVRSTPATTTPTCSRCSPSKPQRPP